MADVMAMVGTAIETLKKLRAVAEKIKDAETRNLIADLSISLADLKMEIASLKEENLRLDSELKQKKSREAAGEQLVIRDGVLYFNEPPPGKAAGPYCPNCKENNRLVLIKDNRNTPFQDFGNFHCAICDCMF
jgi:uncharacterized small protein (DUF1192 family)